MELTLSIPSIQNWLNIQSQRGWASNLCHQKFNELPNIAQSFIRQVSDKRATVNNRYDLMARALKVFDASIKDTTRLTVSDSDSSAVTAYCRNVVRKLLTKESK